MSLNDDEKALSAQKKLEEWINSPYISQKDREELKELSDINDITDRFAIDLAFGTGGMRGVLGLGTNRMNIYTFRAACIGLCNYLKDISNNNSSVVIGYDTRNMSEEFANEACDVFSAYDILVYKFDRAVPTPLLSFAVRQLKTDIGLMITASHNPAVYNGLKVYTSDGCQALPDVANTMTSFFSDSASICPIPENNNASQNVKTVPEEIHDEYIKNVLLQSTCNKTHDIKVVYTPLHGAGKEYVSRVLKQDGFVNVLPVKEQYEPNGNFPGITAPNPENRDSLDMGIKLALSQNADIVIGTDADSDRIGVAVNDNGDFKCLSGNCTAAILLNYMLEVKSEKFHAGSVFITTIVTGELVCAIAKRHNIKIIKTLTGFKYIGEQITLRENDSSFNFVMGCEESYGYLAGTYARDKDAVVTAMLLCEAADYYKSQNKTLYDVLNELYAQYGYYLDQLDSFTLPGIEGSQRIKAAMETLRNQKDVMSRQAEIKDYEQPTDSLPLENVLKYIYEDASWVAVRPSGTEPKIKIYYSLRGENEQEAQKRLEKLRSEFYGIMKL